MRTTCIIISSCDQIKHPASLCLGCRVVVRTCIAPSVSPQGAGDHRASPRLQPNAAKRFVGSSNAATSPREAEGAPANLPSEETILQSQSKGCKRDDEVCHRTQRCRGEGTSLTHFCCCPKNLSLSVLRCFSAVYLSEQLKNNSNTLPDVPEWFWRLVLTV